ncbi:hypothetical protein EON65_52935 [archaeon]|nr:MAG: hypothetical protein EON65_52935 [archaeon]
MSKQQALLQIASEIRRLSKEIKALQRALFQPSPSPAPAANVKDKDKDKSIVLDFKVTVAPGADGEDSKEAMIEQQTKLEEEKRRHELKYEQASGNPYDAPGEYMTLDFCELLFEEIDRQDRRSFHFLQKFYDAQANQHIVGMGNIISKEEIATSILVMTVNLYFIGNFGHYCNLPVYHAY